MESDVVAKVSSDELDEINLIMTKKDQGQQMLDRVSFPNEMNENIIAAYYKGAGDLYSSAVFMEKNWWKKISSNYNLEGVALSLDTISGNLTKSSDMTKLNS